MSNSSSPAPSRLRRNLIAGAAGATVLGTGATLQTVWAQSASDYPNKPVKLVLGFATGGPTDITARAIGELLSKKWGQPVVVENRPGAGSTLAAGTIAKAAPDGYTLLLGVTGSHGIAPSLYKALSYDPLKDFEAISRVVIYANAILVHADVPAKSLQELIALIKSNPAYQTYGTDGNGTASHLTLELLKQRGGFSSQAVQYKGAAPMLADLAGGSIKVGITGLPAAESMIKSGKIRVIALTTERDYSGTGYRTIAEQGFPGFQMGPWSGLFAPKGTPKAIVDKIASDLAEVIDLPEARQKWAALGMKALPNTPEQFRRDLAQEIDSWAEAVRVSGAKVE
jgi:tripartite-type tricarboxylate transporter receptor subunit TctC